ncbi:mycofactocin biosynthesis chaperone MftB, partial [Nocardia brasiliensis]|uniref:mycofactocin biosynthesis chaperone MftB n=1 Tax=Nocardia brasiliensis TaxID=37326 RepID=UPI0024558392
MFDLDDRWQLHPRVALRPEPFGALLYHFGTRKLSFLKSPRIVEIVRSLPAHQSARAALGAAGITAENSAQYVKALTQLVDSEMIIEAPAAATRTPAAAAAVSAAPSTAGVVPPCRGGGAEGGWLENGEGAPVLRT